MWAIYFYADFVLKVLQACIGKPQKKVIFLMAAQGMAIKEFFVVVELFEIFCCHLKYKLFYFRKLIKIWTYHVRVCR